MKRITLPERPDWREKAAAAGFGFHEMYGEPYWTDGAAYVFTMDEIETQIEDPSQELHDMCLDLVGDIVNDDETLTRLSIPEDRFDLIRNSWKEDDRHLYGRFDLAYDGSGPAKMLEYNADTPTSIFEAAYFQHNWLVDQVAAGVLPEGTDQFNMLQESLVEAFSYFPTDRIFHFACWMANDEDRGTTSYLMDCAVAAGHRTKMLDIRAIGVDAEGRFTDTDDITIDRCFKLYPWEDMLREEFAPHLKSGVFVEPAWKSLLSNKGILPLLWARHKGHPNLLPAFFDGDADAHELGDFVRKPFFAREGQNVELHLAGEAEVAPGGYDDDRFIIQGYAPLFAGADRYAVLGSWIVADHAAGLGMREDRSRITKDMSRFVPHIIKA